MRNEAPKKSEADLQTLSPESRQNEALGLLLPPPATTAEDLTAQESWLGMPSQDMRDRDSWRVAQLASESP